LENNIELYGSIPEFDFIDEYNVECDFSNTKLCISKNKSKNSLCQYPNVDYDCLGCIDYSYVDKGICKCMNGFSGIGYVKCKKENKTNNGK